jgi:hypothetical protein
MCSGPLLLKSYSCSDPDSKEQKKRPALSYLPVHVQLSIYDIPFSSLSTIEFPFNAYFVQCIFAHPPTLVHGGAAPSGPSSGMAHVDITGSFTTFCKRDTWQLNQQ